MLTLIGLPGAGKSTLGKQLARRLGVPFLDSDHEIEQRLGCSIRAYFEAEGEVAFRDLEARVIDELTQGTRGVLSTGGGAVLRPDNRSHLRRRTRVFYLYASPEALFRRLRHDRTRPLLQVADPMARLQELHVQRDPLYRETAHHVVDTAQAAMAALLRWVAQAYERDLTAPDLVSAGT